MWGIKVYSKSSPSKSGDRERGQSTVEFALTLMLLLAFVFFYIQLSTYLAIGNYFQYATFMSARALLSGGSTEGESIERASAVLAQMTKRSELFTSLDRFPAFAVAVGGGNPIQGAEIGNAPDFIRTERNFSWLQGVRYSFRGRLFILPFGVQQEDVSVVLNSESWLGRDPSVQECIESLQEARGQNGGGVSNSRPWVLDNGC